MPLFTFNSPEHPNLYSRKPQLVYTKNIYSEGVKVKNWQNAYEQKPIDTNPFCQGKDNHFLSHYHRFGTDDVNSGATTTKEMLQQAFLKHKLVPEKLMNCYYTYNEYYNFINKICHKLIPSNFSTVEDLTPSEGLPCSKTCADDVLTTMQHSYRVPKPYIMQRVSAYLINNLLISLYLKLAIPKIPFMQNRKYRHEIPDWSSFKFYDDNFEQESRELRKHKFLHSKSFNPITGNQLDSSLFE